MKYFYIAIILLVSSCGGVKNDASTKKETTNEPSQETKSEKIAAPVIEDKSIILELKNPNTIDDVKQLIKNSGLTWDKTVFQNDANAIALVKVPGDKLDTWTDRLGKSSDFKSVTSYNQTTLDELIKKAKSSFFAFRKTECFGDCPVYNVAIDEKGNVTFEGLKYVTEKGIRKFKLTDKELTKLKEKLANNDFSQYKKKYDDPQIMDLPSTYISHKDKLVQIRLWKGIPKELIDVHEYVQGLLLDKKYFE